MALIMFDSKTLHAYIQVGMKEEFVPDKDTTAIQEAIDALRKKTEQKMVKLFGEVEQLEAKKKLDNDPELRKKWKAFLEEEYNTDLETIITDIVRKNKEICPGYEGHMKKLTK